MTAICICMCTESTSSTPPPAAAASLLLFEFCLFVCSSEQRLEVYLLPFMTIFVGLLLIFHIPTDLNLQLYLHLHLHLHLHPNLYLDLWL